MKKFLKTALLDTVILMAILLFAYAGKIVLDYSIDRWVEAHYVR